jgi:uncharacterized protein (UPF0261 family)
MAEPEPGQALSVRKLVVETAKYNVLTAHSTREAIDLFHLFPNVSMAIIVGSESTSCEEVGRVIKNTTCKVPLVFLQPQIGAVCMDADHHLPTGEPEALVELLRAVLGDPRKLSQ